MYSYTYTYNVRRILCKFWLLRFLRVFYFVLIIDICTFHFVKYFKLFSLRVRLYTFLEWCLVEGSCIVMHLWSKSLVLRLCAFVNGSYLKNSWVLCHCSE